MGRYLDLVLLSDTHGLHRELDLPAGDILIHSGDFTMFSSNLSTIRDFNDWLGELPHRHKLVIPGNHESFLEADQTRRSMLSNATVLIDEGVTIEGLRFWGSPVTPQAGGAFSVPSPAERRSHWSKVPELDVLITHGPPLGKLDRSPGQSEHMGDPELREIVGRRKPLLHVFGHVHGGHGRTADEDTTYVNSALLGLGGSLDQEPIVVRLPRRLNKVTGNRQRS